MYNRKLSLIFPLLIVATFGCINCNRDENDSSSSIISDDLKNKIQAVLDRLTESQVPYYFKAKIASLSHKNDNSHWCCKVDTPIQTLTQTKLSSFSYISSSTHKCGYNSCGFLNLFSCTRYCVQYFNVIAYTTDYYTVTQATQCPESQVICCTNYLNIMGHCFHLTEIQSNLELLAILNQQGIVLPALVGK